MSKEEFLKIQTCVLKVNIHCDGCKQKVKKILQKIDGVYTIKIESEQGKVTVSGNVDPATLIKKLTKSGKYAELWGGSKPQINNLPNLLKNLQLDHGKSIRHPNSEVQKAPIQQLKGLQDLKMMPLGKDQNQKPAKFSSSDDDDLSGDDDDEYDDDDDYDEDEDEDEDESEDDVKKDSSSNKTKPPSGGNGNGNDNGMLNMLMSGKLPTKSTGEVDNGVIKKVGDGAIISGKGGTNGGNNHGGGKGTGALVSDGKHGGGNGSGGRGQNPKNGSHGGTKSIQSMMGMNTPISQVGNFPALSAVPGDGGGGGGYFTGARPEMAGNNYYQQQLAAMMNQQRVSAANDGFQPMMYARPPPAVNYMPPYRPYPYPPPPGERLDQYNMFNDENTSSCTVM